ncbi:MAG: disulfide oxidoreductase [Candidatus Melainabacteria bacterium GWF2_37_15]|nr:MAG: disulfide oxidoreductase [Candidatus Melainabacteria bacterium GWF2_37_15]
MAEQKITKDMSIIEIVQNYPETLTVFQQYGLGCIGCAAARFENLEAGAKVHGINADQLVKDLNKAVG